MTVSAGCGDSVPASPNPIPKPPARPGFVDLHNPETLVKAKADAKAARNNPKAKVPGRR
jgi:hypothetical protein